MSEVMVATLGTARRPLGLIRQGLAAFGLAACLGGLPALAAPFLPDTQTVMQPILTLLPANATRAALRSEAYSSYSLPIGPWQEGTMLTQINEGRVTHSAWHFPEEGRGTLGILGPLRDGLIASGWQVLYECETDSCGGFDFRYSTQVLPEPDMHVDLGDFRFVSAQQGDQVLSILVSRSAGTGLGYVQLIEVAPKESTPAVAQVAQHSSKGTQPEGDTPSIASALEAGPLVLEGLSFPSGATTLEGEDPSLLMQLASYLLQNPDRMLALVGHTDASGSRAANEAVSQKRAEAVRQRLITAYGVDANRITARGVGFAAPRADNQTAEGRAKNRRVEAVLTSTR